jgi:hypothetical protein
MSFLTARLVLTDALFAAPSAATAGFKLDTAFRHAPSLTFPISAARPRLRKPSQSNSSPHKISLSKPGRLTLKVQTAVLTLA